MTAVTLKMIPRMTACSQFMPAMLPPKKMHEDHARAGRDHNRAAKTFPRFAGADARNHFVPADERADGIGAHVAELRDENEIKQEIFARRTPCREKIDFLDEIQQPRHIHQTEQRRGDGGDARRVGF